MSIISDTHQFVKLEKNTKALSGQRLVRLIAKKNRDGIYESENLNESLAVSVTRLNVDEVAEKIDALLPHIISMCEDVQDKIVREWRIQSGRNEITQAQIGIAEIVAYMDASAAEGGRITKEYLQEWFIADYAVHAMDWFTHKMGRDEETAQKQTNVIRDMFAGFASSKYSPAENICNVMLGFIDKAVPADAIDARMNAYREKIVKIQEDRKNENIFDSLGL